MSITFRDATDSDFHALASMTRELYAAEKAPYPAREEQALRKLLANPHYGQCLLIEKDGAVVGYMIVTFGFSLEFGGQDALLDELYILPAHRGAGIGKAAVAHAADFCQARGIDALHLAVSRSNPAAQKVYRGLGFTERHGYDVLTLRMRSTPS